MIGLVVLAGLVGACLITKKRDVSGIGVPKRRIYREMATAQASHVDFTLPYDEQDWIAKKAITTLTNMHNKTRKLKNPITDEKYYKQLRRAYNMISGVGKTTLPYKESVVRNDRGDEILIYRDYGSETDILWDAIDYVIETYAQKLESQIGYYEALAYIATGGKFVWGSKGEHRGVEALIFGKSSPGERKARLSYLSTPSKGAKYPEAFAEEHTGYYGDDMEILNGVLDCIMQVHSQKQAKDMILELYFNDHKYSDYITENDTPF